MELQLKVICNYEHNDYLNSMHRESSLMIIIKHYETTTRTLFSVRNAYKPTNQINQWIMYDPALIAFKTNVSFLVVIWELWNMLFNPNDYDPILVMYSS